MSELSGKGYRNVRRGRGKKSKEEELMSAVAVIPPTVTLTQREHMGYGQETDGEYRLAPWVRERLANARKAGRSRRRRRAGL